MSAPIRWKFVADKTPSMVTGFGGRLEATAPLSARAPWKCARCKKQSAPVHATDDDAALAVFMEFAQAHAGKECR